MAKKCALTGVGPQYGNNVSHSNRKTRRRFVPNIQVISLSSDLLGRSVRLRLTAATIRTVDHNGGLDAYLLSTSNSKLTDEARSLKRLIKKAHLAKTETAAASA
jgi:large subunit ribosomal protein L28